jgi:hypothetical protein
MSTFCDQVKSWSSWYLDLYITQDSTISCKGYIHKIALLVVKDTYTRCFSLHLKCVLSYCCYKKKVWKVLNIVYMWSDVKVWKVLNIVYTWSDVKESYRSSLKGLLIFNTTFNNILDILVGNSYIFSLISHSDVFSFDHDT